MDVRGGPAVVAGRYRLRELVGEGGMGTVWRADDELLGREVAVKRVRLEGLPAADAALARDRTMREARIAAALHHPNAITIFDVVLEDDVPWLVLEYLPSRSLGAILKERGTLPPGEVAAIGAQLAAALDAAHAAGVVHRDVKPDNVLVSEARSSSPGSGPLVKLTDFGVSHAASAPALTATAVLTGTPAYFAPESARGEGTDARSDLYSLGATLYTAVEGHPPFGTDPGNVLALLSRIGRGQAPPPRNAGHLTDLLRALVADDPARRPTASQAHHALVHGAAALHDAPTVAAHPRPATTRRPTRRRRPLRLVAAVAAALAVVGAAVLAVAEVRGGHSRTAGAPGTGLPPVLVDDPATTDPCSFLDTAALRAHGTVEADRHETQLSGCGVEITAPGRAPVLVNVVLRSPDELGNPAGVSRETLDGRDLYRYSAGETSCMRRVLLSARYAVDVYADLVGGGDSDLCAIAETGARAAIATVADGRIGTRDPVDATTALGATSACGLLQPTDPGLPGLGEPVPGFGGWECSWRDGAIPQTTVVLTFYRGERLHQNKGAPADFAGRAGEVFSDERQCAVRIVQHADPGGPVPRVETLWLSVVRPSADGAPCAEATALATAVAGRLPPPA